MLGVIFMNKRYNYLKLFRPFDMIIIFSLIVASFIPIGIFAMYQNNLGAFESTTAIVLINGEEVDRFILSEETPRQLVTYTSEDGLVGDQYNIVEIYGAQIRVKEDNSPDQIAVRTGWISRPGETSICLPHRLIIELSEIRQNF